MDADEVLATVAGVRLEATQMQESEVFKWRRRYKEVTHADSHQHENVPRSQEKQSPAKNCDTRGAPMQFEHHASTPYTRPQRLMINSMMSKCRTRQPESYDTLSAFLHDWLERCVDRTSDRSQIECESDPALESWGDRSVVVRKGPHDDSLRSRV